MTFIPECVLKLTKGLLCKTFLQSFHKTTCDNFVCVFCREDSTNSDTLIRGKPTMKLIIKADEIRIMWYHLENNNFYFLHSKFK